MRSRETNLLPASAEDTLGPYYPRTFVDQGGDLLAPMQGTVFQVHGHPIVLTGRVLDANGDLVKPLLVEFWQPDAQGRYRTARNWSDPRLDPWFEGFGRQYSDDGTYLIRTVKPGNVLPERPSEGVRAPHVTLTFFCDGISRLTTQVLFEDEPLTSADPLLVSLPVDVQSRLVARREGLHGGCVWYRRDIVFRGADETPFFDDLVS